MFYFIRLFRIIRVRLIPQWVFEHGFYGLTRMLIEVMVLSSRQLFLCSLAFGSFAMFKIYHG